MSSEHDEQHFPAKRPPQNSFTRALDILSNKDILEKIQRTINSAVSICQSTGADDTHTLFLTVDTSDEDEEKLTTLGAQMEEIHKYPDWRVVRKQSETPQQFSRMYKNLTLLSPDNIDAVQAFAEQCKAEETQLASGSKKLKVKP